jgi:hypothetical protein
MREKSNAYRIVTAKQEGKIPRCRWVDNIKMDLREIGWGSMNWIDLIQDRDRWKVLVSIVMNPWVP